MENTTLLIIAFLGLLVTGLLALQMKWLKNMLRVLMQQIDKTSPQSFEGLEKTDIERLRADAVARYESVMARELIRFEAEIEKTSNDLLENLQAHTNKPDEKLMTVMNHMIQSTEAGYQTALDKLITNLYRKELIQLPIRLGTVDFHRMCVKGKEQLSAISNDSIMQSYFAMT